jgi:hypothetical protein
MNSHIALLQTFLLAQRRLLAVLAAYALCLSACSAWSQTTATVSVNAASTEATVEPEAYGVDCSVYDGYLTYTGNSTLLSEAGIDAMRYPGGSYGDIFNFISGTDQTLNDGGYFAPGDEFNFFMSDLVVPEGGKAVITVNYGSDLTGTIGGQPSEAASWVQYANVTNNYGIVYWEIGNEIYGNGYYSTGLDWEYDLHYSEASASARVGQSALSPTAYGTNAAAFVKAMKAVDPNIKVGVFVNVASYYTAWDQDVLTAVSSALAGTGYTIDFVDYHWYPYGTDANQLAFQYSTAAGCCGDAAIASVVAQVRSDIAKYYTLSNASELQILVTETGVTSASGNPGIMPALFAADDDLTWFENGGVNVEYQEMNNGFLTDAGPSIPQGPWYATQLDSTIARPGDNLVTASSTNALLRVHAVKRTDGQTGVILINEDPSNNTTATLNITGATLAGTGTEYSFGTANFTSGSATANSGVASSSVSGLGNTFTVTVPAYSMLGLLIPAGTAGSFSLKPSASTLSIAQGASATDTITVTDVSPFAGSVTLAASGMPTGVTAAFATNPTTSTSVLTLTASATAAVGTSTVTITGTSGSLTATTTVALTVTAKPGFTLTPSAGTLSVAQGKTATDTITVTDTGGFTGSVTLTATGLPSGVTVAYGTNPTTSTSVLTFTASATATVGTSTVTVTGTSGTTTATTTIALTAATGGNFTLASSASTLSIAQSASGTDTIKVTDVSPFTGSVTLAASGLPTGVTATFATNPTTSTSVLTLTASATATVGTSTVTITGTSGSLTATTTVALTVTAKPGFTLTPSAATLSVTQGKTATDTIAVTDAGGFTGSVTLTATGLPSGVTVAYGTNPTTATSVLTFTATSTATAGTSTVTITGTSGTTTATTTVALTVAPSGGNACTVDYTISPQNTSQFGATITIVNNGSTALSNWVLTWSFANGQTISSSWNGAVSQSGASVTVSEQSGQTWENIPAGGSYSGFGFNGTWNGTTNAIPTAFSLNGTACTVN